jgi:hypothetical protein
MAKKAKVGGKLSEGIAVTASVDQGLPYSTKASPVLPGKY